MTSQAATMATDTKELATEIGPYIRVYKDGTIVVGGDSAAGNIMHHMALRAGAASETSPDGMKIYGAFLAQPYFYSSKAIGSEPVEGFEESLCSLFWKMACPSAPDGLDDPMVNPVAAGAPKLAGLGCSKMLVCIAGKDVLRDRGIWYYEAVKKSGWKGELKLLEEKEEDHVYHIFNPHSENSMKLIKRLASFILE